MRDIDANLPATVVVHENLRTPEEIDATREILYRVDNDAGQAHFWNVDAGEFLVSVSCDLNDALFPYPAEEAGVYNLFQLITAKLADRARVDHAFRDLLLAHSRVGSSRSLQPATITKMLGIAIADHDAGRLSRGQLLSIFQDAIDNGDILAESNQLYAIANVLPLVDAGLLRRSSHLDRLEAMMNQKALDFLKKKEAHMEAASRPSRWWEFWK